MSIALEIGSSYKFSTIAPTILNSEYKNMILESIMSVNEAVKCVDVYGRHEQIKQIPGVNIPSRASDLHYLKFVAPSGEPLYIAREYLVGLELISNKTLLITINNYSAQDYRVIEDTLKQLGFEDMKFELVEK